MFRAKSWGNVPYDAKDGKMMFCFIEQRIDQSTHTTLFNNASLTKYSSYGPTDFVALSFPTFNSQSHKACVGVVQFSQPLEPPFLRWVKGILHQDSKTEFTNHGAAVSAKDVAEFTTSQQMMAFQMGEGLNDMGEIESEFKKIEDNGHLKLSDDFLYLQVNDEMRVYPISSIPPVAAKIGKLVIKRCQRSNKTLLESMLDGKPAPKLPKVP